MKRHLTKIFLGALVGILVSACGKPTMDPDKARYQAGANYFYGKITRQIDAAKGFRSSGRGVASGFSGSGSYYNGNFNSNSGLWVPSNNVYMSNDPNQEISKCRSDFASAKASGVGRYYKIYVSMLFQCLQAAVQYQNPYQTYMYRNSGQSAQPQWQYTNFSSYPGAYSQYYSSMPQYSYLNQYLSQGFLSAPASYMPQ